MRHPFDGINDPQEAPRVSRRMLLGGFFAAVAGLLGAQAVARAQIRQTTTRALRETGGTQPSVPLRPTTPTRPTPIQPVLPRPPIDRSRITMAWPEEGRWPGRPLPPTTLAAGEEGGATTF